MTSPRILVTTIAALLAGSSAYAANYTWDPVAGDGGTITSGDGIWDDSATNLIWNSGAGNLAWTAGNTAVFGGSDGTYAISIGANVSTAGIVFNNSGYILSAATPFTITNTNSGVTVAAGKTATIGSNVTMTRVGGYIFDGGGRLIVTGAINNSTTTPSATDIRGGTTLEIATGGRLTLNASPVVGSNSPGATNFDGNMLISGGTVTINGSSNFVVGNLTSGTTNAVATITGGSLTITSTSANGIRFGSNSPAGSGWTVNGTFNLDGGIVTTPTVTRFTPTGTGVINATFNFNGGTLRTNRANATFFENLTATNVKAGGAKIDSNGFNITIAQPLLDGGGGGGLEKLGAGTLTLTGGNTYTGSTTISAGTLEVGSGGASGTLGTGPVVNNSILSINRSNSYAFAGGISGSGVVNLAGAGTVSLGGANTYTGATNVNAGRLNLTGSLTSNIALASGANLGGEGSTTGSITFGGAHTLFFDPGSPAALTANTVNATGATVTLSLTANTSAANGIVILNAPGGITGTAGTGGNFQFAGRGNAYLNGTSGTATQLLFDYTPATLVWKGNATTNPTFWDVDTTANWDNAGSADKFITGDTVILDDTASSFVVNVQSSSPQPTLVTFNNNATNTYTLQGAGLSGTGKMVKNGIGTVIVTNDNTYSGGTTINTGTIQLGDGISATGTLGAGPVVNNAAIVANFGGSGTSISNGMSGSGSLTQNGSGTVTLTGTNSYSGATTINGGTLQIGNGGTSGTLGSGVVINNGTLDFNRSDNFTVSNAISGAGVLRKLGAGILTLGTSNTYTGATTISGGAILLTSGSGVLGDTTSGTSVTQGGALQLQGGIKVTGELLTLAGDGINGSTAPGALRNLSGNNEWAADITIGVANTTRVVSDSGSLKLSGNISLSPNTGDQFVLQGNGNGEVSGVISGSARVTKSVSGTGAWTLSGANTYTGRTTISGGALHVSSLNSVVGGSASSSLGAPTTVANGTIDFGNGGTSAALVYTGAGETTDRVLNLSAAGTGAAILDQSGTGLLKFTSNLSVTGTSGTKALTLQGSTAGAGEFAGGISNGTAGSIVGVGKLGSGTWTLSGENSYTGATRVAEGTLAIAASGSISGSTSIEVSGGANLNVSALASGFTLGPTQTLTGGVGTSAGRITGALIADTGSTVAPGLGDGITGTLSVSNGFSLNSDAHLKLDINGGVAGSGYDQIIVTGGNITLAGDLAGSLITFMPNFHDVFYIVLNNGAGTTSGTLGGIAEGGSFFIGAQEFQISYTSDFGGGGFALNGSGNDVALLAIPEPASAASLLAGIGGLLGLRRRRR